MRILLGVNVFVLISSSAADASSFYDCLIPNYALKDAVLVSGEYTLEGCKRTCDEMGSGCKAWTFHDTSCSTSDEANATVAWVNPSAENGGILTWLGDCNCPNSNFSGQELAAARPLGLQCWPKTPKGKLLQCSLEVLQSTSKGWRGNCEGLVEQTLIPGADCEKTCHENPWCSTWQLVTPTETDGEDSGCWQGVGYDCQKSRGNQFKAHSARLQHGKVKVIQSLTDYRIMGLFQVFDALAHENVHSAKLHCKEVCYSDLHCQFWQFFTKTGCWVESADNIVPYPMQQQMEAADSKDETPAYGEFIQHYCEQPPKFDWSTVENGNLNVGDRVWVPETTRVCVLATGPKPQTMNERRLPGIYTLPGSEEPRSPVDIAQTWTRPFPCVLPPEEMDSAAAGDRFSSGDGVEQGDRLSKLSSGAGGSDGGDGGGPPVLPGEAMSDILACAMKSHQLCCDDEKFNTESCKPLQDCSIAVGKVTGPLICPPPPHRMVGGKCTKGDSALKDEAKQALETCKSQLQLETGSEINSGRRLSILGNHSMHEGEFGTIIEKVDRGTYNGLFGIVLADGRRIHARPEDLSLEAGGAAPPVPTGPLGANKDESSSISIWPWLLFGLLASTLLALALLLWCCCCRDGDGNGKRKGPSKGRGRKVEPTEPLAKEVPTTTASAVIPQAVFAAPRSLALAQLAPAPAVVTHTVPVQYAPAPPPVTNYVVQSVTAGPVPGVFAPQPVAATMYAQPVAAWPSEERQRVITRPASYPDPLQVTEPVATRAGAMMPSQHYG